MTNVRSSVTDVAKDVEKQVKQQRIGKLSTILFFTVVSLSNTTQMARISANMCLTEKNVQVARNNLLRNNRRHVMVSVVDHLQFYCSKLYLFCNY